MTNKENQKFDNVIPATNFDGIFKTAEELAELLGRACYTKWSSQDMATVKSALDRAEIKFNVLKSKLLAEDE